MNRVFAAIVLLFSVAFAQAEDVRIVTWNVELFQSRFDVKKYVAWAKTLPKSEELTDLIKKLRNVDDHSLWEVASVILDPKLSPDILLIEEGCDEENLKYFNHKWLSVDKKEVYETVMVFPTNSGRDQNLCMLLKPGFKVLKVQDDYYKEKDPVSKDFLEKGTGEAGPNGDMLFARGPAFVLVQTPGGKQLWVGMNHQKSKYGNDVNVAKWRNREAGRIHEIIKEVEKEGPTPDVVFGGDMNDELGMQEFEQEAGGDSISKIIGPPEDGVVMATKPLADANAISYGGYWRDFHRSMIDHFFVTQSMKDKIAGVSIFKEGMAPAASDHFPVLLQLKL